MKSFLLLFLLAAGITASGQADQNPKPHSAPAIGIQLSQTQKDFGIGINISSRYYLGDKIAFRLRGNCMFNEHVKDDYTTWDPYANLSLGVVINGGAAAQFVRLYGEGGSIALLPSSEFSDRKYVLGGYGLFGFEFNTVGNYNYFIEIGGVGTGAKADKVLNKPIYSNGFLVNAGFRINL